MTEKPAKTARLQDCDVIRERTSTIIRSTDTTSRKRWACGYYYSAVGIALAQRFNRNVDDRSAKIRRLVG